MKPLKGLYKALYFVLVSIGNVFIRPFFPVRARGRQNLPQSGGFVLAPNHVRAIDPMYILLGYGYRKKMLVMGKAELFGKNPVMDFLWNCFGGFPIERGAGNRDVLNAAIDEVKGGRGLLVFPEGTRSRDGNLGKLKSGAFVAAAAAEVPLVPCHIRYAAGKPKIFRRITVVFGLPVRIEELGLTEGYGPRQLREAKHLFMDKMKALREMV